MYCESCGTFIPDGQSFCSNCGSPAPISEAPAQAPVEAPASAPAPAPAPGPAPAPVTPVPVAPIPVMPQQNVGYPVSQPMAPQPPMAVPVAQPVYQQPIYSQPVYQQPAYQQPTYAKPVTPVKTNGLAKAGLVFGILTVCFSWIPAVNVLTVPVFALLGLIFSTIGIFKKKYGGLGKAITGLILTLIGLAISIGMYVYAYERVKEVNSHADFMDAMEEAAELFDEIFDLSSTVDYDDSSISDIGTATDEYFVDGDLVLDGSENAEVII